jgi:hypothetical protein
MSEGIIAWLGLLLPSAIVGIICGYFIKKRRLGIMLAFFIPWFGLLTYLLYKEYFVPYQGGGASMWPIAQIFGGTIAAGTGVSFYLLSKILIKKNKENS